MPEEQISPIAVERAAEQLRQEQETFDQKKRHVALWFYLQLIVGYSSVLLLFALLVAASYVLVNASSFPLGIVVTAAGALFVDAIGLVAAIWKSMFSPGLQEKLTPVTQEDALTKRDA